jgi:succinoglycan biosynthesis protein ExoL
VAGADRVEIAYLVHDLQDAAVARRVEMLRGAGHGVRVAGFFRRDTAPAKVAGADAINLGRTRDGGLVMRLFKVLFNLIFTARVARAARGADVLIARNLEMLVLAARLRRGGQRLVYECLDIHRLMLGRGMGGRLMRAVERWAMRRLDLLLVSSPHFLEAYFSTTAGYRGPALLVENKVPAYAPGAVAPPQVNTLPGGATAMIGTPGAPWVIGWFGMLRCRRTLAMLGRIAAANRGCIRIVIAGKPSQAEFPDFDAEIAGMPHVTYAGPYGPADLPQLFGAVHFIWAIDYFEEGLNSKWLLPNRLYEGIAHGAVPIALAQVATGQWLAQRGIGLRLREPVAELEALLREMTFADYRRLRAKVAAVEPGDVLLLAEEHATCVTRILGLEERVAPSVTPGAEAGVLIVVPCLNEEAHLPALLVQMLDDNPDAQIVVADGGSQDRSRAIVEDLATRHPALRLMHNPARLQAAGVNLAARSFGQGLGWMVRIDAHCDYPRGYVAGLIRAAQARQASSVVVPMITRGMGCFQRGVAAAQNSVLGNGGSPHRSMGQGRFVDHGHHALFDLALFRGVGGYDERFSHNEDAELDHRLRQMGGRIWLEPAQAIVYYPRPAPGPLLRQYRGYGKGRAQTLRRHRMPMALRQAAPLAVAPAVGMGLAGVALAPITPLGWVLALPMLGWAGLCFAYGAFLALRQRRACVLCAGLAAIIMHFGWSLGFLAEIWPVAMRAGAGPASVKRQLPR